MNKKLDENSTLIGHQPNTNAVHAELEVISISMFLKKTMKMWDFKQESVNTETVNDTINLLHEIIKSLTFFQKLNPKLEINEDITDKNIKQIYDLEVKWNERAFPVPQK